MNQWFALNVNPDPWAIGPLGVGKKGGKFYPYVGRNEQLANYKAAVVELLDLSAGSHWMDPDRGIELRFWFWRRLDGTGKNVKHGADVTNLQKATEDALQDHLISNDRNVRKVTSELVAQGPDVQGAVVLCVGWYQGFDPQEVHSDMIRDLSKFATEDASPTQNEWPPRA